MKHADSMPHSSGRSGGDSLVLEKPAAGVLQKIPTPTDCIDSIQIAGAGRFPLFGSGTSGRYGPHDNVFRVEA
jgi:hypothetical protein